MGRPLWVLVEASLLSGPTGALDNNAYDAVAARRQTAVGVAVEREIAAECYSISTGSFLILFVLVQYFQQLADFLVSSIRCATVR